MKFTHKPIVSVCIPALNEGNYIATCLQSLLNQTVPKDHYEILVILSTATTDNTAEICEQYGARVIYEKPGIGRARWRGFKEAKGEILAATDADTIVPERWLEDIIEDFVDPDVVSVTGPVYPPRNAGTRQKMAFWFGTNVYKAVGAIERKAYLSGMNFAVRRSAYEACGGFDPEIKAGEDTDLTNRISKLGKTVFDKHVKVVTSTRRLGEGYIKSFVRYSWNYIQLKRGKAPPDFPHFREEA